MEAVESPGMTLRKGVKSNMLNVIKHFATSLMARVRLASEEGQAMVEYSLILALISVAAILALTTIGTDVKAALEAVVTALAGV